MKKNLGQYIFLDEFISYFQATDTTTESMISRMSAVKMISIVCYPWVYKRHVRYQIKSLIQLPMGFWKDFCRITIQFLGQLIVFPQSTVDRGQNKGNEEGCIEISLATWDYTLQIMHHETSRQPHSATCIMQCLYLC